MEPEVSPITEFLTNVGEIVTSAIGWMGEFWAEISGDPVLLCVVIGIPLVGLGVGLLQRLIRVN